MPIDREARRAIESAAEGAKVGGDSVRNALRTVLPLFLLVRILSSVWMWGVRQVVVHSIPPEPTLRPYLGVSPETNPWLEPWQRWDTLHYQAITERGYQAFEGALFTPPLFPTLTGLVSQVIGSSSLLAGLIVSSLAYLAGLLAFHHLAQRELGRQSAARRATVYLAVFPTAFFFLAAYTESLLLLGSTTAILATQDRRWLAGALAAAAAATSRLVGLAIVLPLAYCAYTAWRESESWRGAIPLLGAVIGSAVLPLYAWMSLGLGPLAPLQAQTGRFRGGFAVPGANLIQAAGRLVSGKAFMADVIDIAFLVLFLICAVPVWRKYSPSIRLLYLGFLTPLLVRSAGSQPLLGTARYVLALFPAFFVLSEWADRPWRRRLVLYGSTAGFLYLSGQFAIWGWVG